MAFTRVMIILLVISNKTSADLYFDVAMFCSKNGLNYITLSSFPQLHHETFKMANELWKHNLMFRQLSLRNIQKDYVLDGAECIENKVICPLDTQLYQDSIVLMAKSDQLNDKINYSQYLSIIKRSKVKRGLLVFTTPLTAFHKSKLNEMLDNISENSLFYIAYQDDTSTKTKYMQAITVRKNNNAILNPIVFNNNGVIIEKYNLKGMKIFSMTLSWAPFFTVENCDSNGKNCDCYGLYGDLMTEMGRIMNFTWDSHIDPEANWGVRPISGPFNKSGIWGGVMGSIINGDYPISLSQWVWNSDRYNLVDFISTCSDNFLLALTPKPPDVDTGLFIRPFTNDAWTGKFIEGIKFFRG